MDLNSWKCWIRNKNQKFPWSLWMHRKRKSQLSLWIFTKPCKTQVKLCTSKEKEKITCSNQQMFRLRKKFKDWRINLFKCQIWTISTWILSNFSWAQLKIDFKILRKIDFHIRIFNQSWKTLCKFSTKFLISKHSMDAIQEKFKFKVR